MKTPLVALTLAFTIGCSNPRAGKGGGSPDGMTSVAHDMAHVQAGACDHLAAAGVWENITPPVTPLHGIAPCAYGGEMVMDPQDPSVVYVGSCNQGIWKSIDCGSTWTHINTGKNGDALDAGRQWTFVMDPTNPDVLYTNSGYNTCVQGSTSPGNCVSGAFKSTNGGVDWDMIWPPSDPALAQVVQYNFVAQIAMDRTNAQHLLVGFHASCNAPHPAACFGETMDGGATWHIIDGLPQWTGGEGHVLYFLGDSTTWLLASQTDGLWRTSDGGAHWTDLDVGEGHAAGALYRAKSGVWYMSTPNGILRSPDGVAWTLVQNSGNTMLGLTGNGTTLFASRGFPWDPSSNLYEPFWTSPENDGEHWTQLGSPMLSNGGTLAYDSAHHVLYSTDLGAGVWRVVTP